MNKKQKDIISEFYPKRDEDSRKYEHGLVIIIGGSRYYTGSPILSAMAALRAGADISHIIGPRRAADIAASYSPDLISFPIDSDHLSPSHLSDLLALTRSGRDVSKGKIAVVIGGGIGRDEETKSLVREYIKNVEVPIVVDADAIYAFEGKKEIIREYLSHNSNILFTPHLYEFFVLTGKSIHNVKYEERKFLVKQSAEDISANILLKGGIDIISDGESVKENDIKVPQLTVGGTGDVLAGIAGALMARGFSPLKAGEGPAVINTLAGEITAKEKGESVIATDLIDNIYKVIN